MIIFFNRKSGEIYGTLNGRVHTEKELNEFMVRPENVPIEDVGKFIAEFETIYKEVVEPVMGFKLIDKKNEIYDQVQIGTKKVKKGDGMIPTGKFASKVTLFEDKPDELFKYKIKVDKKGELADFIIK